MTVCGLWMETIHTCSDMLKEVATCKNCKRIYKMHEEKRDEQRNKRGIDSPSKGLLPDTLSREQVETLEKEYGDDWFWVLGYSEKIYKRPKFE